MESRHPDDGTTEDWGSNLVAQALDLLNIDDPNNTSNDIRIKELLNKHAEAIRPPGTAARPRTQSEPPRTLTARQKRRAEYAMIQKAYHKDRKRCVQTILNGHWKYDILTAQPRVTKKNKNTSGAASSAGRAPMTSVRWSQSGLPSGMWSSP